MRWWLALVAFCLINTPHSIVPPCLPVVTYVYGPLVNEAANTHTSIACRTRLVCLAVCRVIGSSSMQSCLLTGLVLAFHLLVFSQCIRQLD